MRRSGQITSGSLLSGQICWRICRPIVSSHAMPGATVFPRSFFGITHQHMDYPDNIAYRIPSKHICTMFGQRRRRWADAVQMLYKCFVFALAFKFPRNKMFLIRSLVTVEYFGEPPWPWGDVFGLRPPGLKFQILCLEGSVISFLSPCSGRSPGTVQLICARRWPKTPLISFHLLGMTPWPCRYTSVHIAGG